MKNKNINKIKISISIDLKINEILEKDSINKSKLINSLLLKYFKEKVA